MNVSGLSTLSNRFFDRLNKQKNKKLLWFEIYSLVFVVTFFAVFSPFILGNKTFVWEIDGSYQMLPWLFYVGKFLRRVFEAVFHGGFSIPLFDISLGWGEDIIGYLGSNGHMEPIAALLSALLPLKQIETLYIILIFLRLYLAGLAFLYMCRYFAKDPAWTIAGALIYLFNGYTIFCGTCFPYFLDAMVLLPLLIVGADRILHRKISGLFVFCIFYSGLCGFYLLYFLSAITAIYALVRFFGIYHKGERLKAFPVLLLRGILLYVLGAGLAAPVLLPAFAELFASARSHYNSFFFSTDFMEHWRSFWERFLALAAPKRYYEPDWGVDFHAYAALFLLCFVLLFLKKGRKTLKWLMVIGFIVFFSPLGGWMMNGFQYSSNRWSFGFALLVGYVVVEMLPDLLQMNRRDTGVLIFLICLYAVLGVSIYYTRVSVFVSVGAAFLAITLLVVRYVGRCSQRIQRMVCVLLVAVNLFTNALYTIVPDGLNWIGWFADSGDEILKIAFAMEAEGEKFPFYNTYMDGRFDSSSFLYNNSLYYGIPGTLFYSSTINGNPVRFLEEMEESGNEQNFKIHSTDQRTMMDTLMSIKYVLEKSSKSNYVPYGYKRLGLTYDERYAYKNEYALPWGYTYSESVSYDDIDDMNGIQKQQALLQAVALEGGGSDVAFDFDEARVPYTFECENCDWSEGVLKTREDGAITLNADLLPGREYYVRLKNFDVDNYWIPNQIISTWAASFNFFVECGDIEKYSRAESPQYTCYYGRKNYLFNLGCGDEKRDTITIRFTASGKFRLEDIELYELPMTHYGEWVDALREEPLENIQMETNKISGTVDLSREKILCMTIPYSKGWTAYVDGQRADILKANYAFMGLRLSEGHHEIVFKYFTPGLKLGLILCGLSLCAACVLFIIVRRKRFNHGTV